MPQPLVYLIVFITFLSCTAFAYGILKACLISLAKQPDTSQMAPFLSSTVTSIGAVLATNLGAVLGIAVTNPTATFANLNSWNPTYIFFQFSSVGSVQILACYFYVVGLVMAAITWAIKNFTTDPKLVVALIPELTKSLLGVMVGALAITLSEK